MKIKQRPNVELIAMQTTKYCKDSWWTSQWSEAEVVKHTRDFQNGLGAQSFHTGVKMIQDLLQFYSTRLPIHEQQCPYLWGSQDSGKTD